MFLLIQFCLQTQNEHKYMKTYVMMADFCRGVHSPSPQRSRYSNKQSVKYSNRTVIRSVYFLVETPLKNPRHAPGMGSDSNVPVRLHVGQYCRNVCTRFQSFQLLCPDAFSRALYGLFALYSLIWSYRAKKADYQWSNRV